MNASNCAVVYATLLVAAASAGAADPLTVELLAADDSLVGWGYGATPPHGWTLKDGVLSGDSSSSVLVGGWTLGDFELAFDWAVADGGAWTIALPPLADGPAWAVTLCEGDGCGALRAGETVLAPGQNAAAVTGDNHRAIVRRFGRRFEVVVDGQSLTKVELPDDSRRLLQLSLTGGCGTLSQLTLDEPLGQPLLTAGLEGWQRTSPGRPWTWVDGEVRAPGDGSNYLRSDEIYENFVFTLEYKQPAGANSGLGIRTPVGGWPSGDGMELQLYDEPAGKPLNKQSTAAIYGNVEPLARADRADAWNRVVVRAEGFLITVWINGRLVQHFNTRDCPELKYRNLKGWIGLQDHNDPARFRNVHVLRLPEGKGPAAWYAARPEPASRFVLEPLMNSERVAEALKAEWDIEEIDLRRERERTIKLAGPGALVGVSGGGVGIMRIVLDDGPPMDCPLGELPEGAPQITTGPLIATYLPFRSRALIVCTSDEPTVALLEHVRLYPEKAADSLAETAERGMLSALSYRQQQLEGGRHREGDPLPSIGESVESLAPAASLAVAAPVQRGVVKRLVLRTPAGVLSDDVLWIEITVDGEIAPALAAPARYLFPGLAAGPYANFVVTARGGFVNLLGMPFAAGLEARVINRGAEPIADVELRLVYDSQEDRISAAIEPGLRLRGAYTEAGASEPALAGEGRLVGIVAAADEDGTLPAYDSDAPVEVQWALSKDQNEQRWPFSGRADGLVWRWLLLAPLEVRNPFRMEGKGGKRPGCLLLYYGRPSS